jgi:adhesin/invasin
MLFNVRKWLQTKCVPVATQRHGTRLRRRRFLEIECLERRITPAFNLTIGTAATANVLHDTFGNFTATGSGANINVADIRTDLLAGRNVSISNGSTGAETGNITWLASSDLDFNGIGTGLDLAVTADPSTQAAAQVVLNSRIIDSDLTTPDSLSISISAAHDLTVSNVITSGSGVILLQADASDSGSGTLHLTSGAAVNSASGSANGVTLRAADTDIQPGSSISSDGTNVVTFVPGTTIMNNFIAGLSGPAFDTVDALGNIYVSIPGGNVVDEFSSSGVPVRTFTAMLSTPEGVAIDTSGNLYVANAGNGTIVEYASGGVSVVQNGLASLAGLAVDPVGTFPIYASYNTNAVYEVGVGPVHTGLSNPQGLAFDSAGDLFVANNGASQIVKYGLHPATLMVPGAPRGVAVDPSGNVYATLAGGQVYEVGAGTIASGSAPDGLASDTQGNLYAVYQGSGSVSKIIPGPLSSPTYDAFDASGNLYVSNGGSNSVVKISPDGAISSFATVNTPRGIAIDTLGNVYVADNTGNQVMEFHSNGSLFNTFSGLSGPVGIALDSQNNLYVANAGSGTIMKFPAVGGTPTMLDSGLTGLTGLATDTQTPANVYAAFGGNSIVKVLSTGGSPAILTSSLSSPEGLAIDSLGDLFVGNQGSGAAGNGTISELSTGGKFINAAYASGLTTPVGLALNEGNLYVASNTTGAISKVLLAGTIVVRSSVESRPMNIGGAAGEVAGINLTDAELANISTGPHGGMVFGDGSQTGNITFKTATPATTAGAAVTVLQSTTGSGQIALDDDASGVPGAALNGNGGSVSLTAGSGGIVAVSTTNSIPEISTSAAVTLDTTGGIGSSTNRIQFDGAATPSSVVIGTNNQPASAVFLDGLGALNLGAITTSNASLDVTAAGTLTLAGAIATGGGNISLNPGTNAFADDAGGTINAGSGSVTVTADTIAALAAAITGNGGITLQPKTAGVTIGLNDPTGSFNLTKAEMLELSSTGTVTLGAATSGAVSVAGTGGALDLSSDPYNLMVRGGPLTFDGSLTVDGTLTLATGAVTNKVSGGAADVLLGGASTLLLAISGDVGSAAANLITRVANLGASTVGGNVFITNNGSLTTTGTISATGSLNITLTSGDFTTDAGDLSAPNTITLAAGGNQKLTSSGQSVTNLVHSGAGILTLADNLTVTGNFTNQNGAGNVDISNRTVNVGGNWSWGNSGSLVSIFSTVHFDGTNQAISGNTSFYNATKTVSSADTLTFQAGSTQFVAGVLTLSGAAGNPLSLRSSTPGTQWMINPQGYRSVSYLDVQDSFNINATALAPAHSTDSGNNTNWLFGPGGPGAPAIIGSHAGSGQSVTVGANYAPLSVQVSDAFGNLLSGVSVTFTAPAAGASGTFGNAHSATDTETTDASGTATTAQTFTANTTAGGFTVSATAGLISTSFQLTNTPGSASKLVFLSTPPSSNTATAGQTLSDFQVAIEDADGNVVTSDQNALTVSLANGSFSSGTTNVNAVDGVATFSGLVTQLAGANTLDVADSTDALTTISAPISINPGSPAITTIESGSGQAVSVGSSFAALSALVTDAYGNPLSGINVSFTAPAGGPGGTFMVGANSVASATASTDSDGVATAPTFTANTSAGSFLVTAAAAGTGAADFDLTNLAAGPARIVALSGTLQSATVSTAFAPLQALVTDSFGNPVGGASVTFAVVAGSQGASGTFAGNATVTTNANGVATAPTLTAGTVAGSFLATASVSGAANAASFTLTDTPGAASSVTAVGGTPQNTIIASTFGTALQAKVVDAFGNPVAGVPVTFAAPLAGPSGTFNALTTVLTDTRGIATAPALTANHIVGSFTVTATVAGITNPANFTLTNTIVPAAIKTFAGTPQHTTVNTAYASVLKARVTDSHGKPVAGITVVFELPAGASGTFAGSATVVTDANGVATAPALTANTTAGTFIVNAWVAGVATPAKFTLTNTAGAAASVKTFLGTPQSAKLGKTYAQHLEAEVLDAFGNPVSGVKVIFTAPASGASGSFSRKTTATATTNGKGVATAPAFTANNQAGSFSVTASVTGIASTASFSLTNVAAAGPKVGR